MKTVTIVGQAIVRLEKHMTVSDDHALIIENKDDEELFEMFDLLSDIVDICDFECDDLRISPMSDTSSSC